ncbi:MAG: hypothetical protein LUI04_00715 [Porphyromonadaceae bacterium]|nr:hypothetical protein [Porphyromonadaceae bacterium]
MKSKMKWFMCALAMGLTLQGCSSEDEAIQYDAIQEATGTLDGYDYVDLGLSVKWAACNIGASSPTEYGSHFAWGETKTKSSYTEDNCVTFDKEINDIAVDSVYFSYDAARANWGDAWRMPTKDEMDELMNKCQWTWVRINRHKGYKVTGPNGNSIFLPAAGWCVKDSLYDTEEIGYYWSSTPDESHTNRAYYLEEQGGGVDRYWSYRYLGFSIRPVMEEEDPNPLNGTNIPSDNLAEENPEIGTSTTTIPNVQYTIENDGDDVIIRLDMTGIQDASTSDWLRLVGTAQNGQNVWLSIDGNPKGILVYNTADDEDEDVARSADLVFLVDNSGSMSEEADAIARDIISWSKTLEQSGLDILFGCVGYSESGTINGGINLTTPDALSTFLNRATGTSRTMGFSGTDASLLQSAASSYKVSNECGGMALRYADANISFRSEANRIYVNFTDEPNQPAGNEKYSVEYFADQSNWATTQGTVHTVYSADTTFTEKLYYTEKPWHISEYTGGTILVAPSDFSNVTLEDLPVSGAMHNSYIIRFTNVSEYMDGQSHIVKITILSADGKTRAEKIFYMTFGTAN